MAKKHSPGAHMVDFFNQLSFESIDRLDSFYAENVEFRDPIKSFTDRAALKAYLAMQYKNTVSCRFEPKEIITQGHSSCVEWQMKLHHKYLNLGNEIRLDGTTLVEADPKSGLIISHRDYFDISAFVLKSVPGVSLLKGLFG